MDRAALFDPKLQPLLSKMLARAVERRVPLNGSIAMTYRCHLRCIHCYLGDERQTLPEDGEEDTGFWCSVIDQIADLGCMDLLMTGGEPLLRPDFAEVYEHAKRRGLLVAVFSNATLVNERIVRLFEDLPPRLVDITLYGASAEVYERVTGVRGSFKRCLDGVDALLNRGVPLALKAMILKDNQHEIPAMREIARARGVRFRLDPALFPCRDGDQAPLEQRVSPAEAVAIEMKDETLRGKTADYYHRMQTTAPEDALFSCMAGLTSFHIDPAGTLLPCLMVTTHGFDLRQGTFRAGWEGVIPRFREQGLMPGYECHRCSTRFLCGHCPAQAGLETGSPHRKSDYLCQLGAARLNAIGTTDALDK